MKQDIKAIPFQHLVEYTDTAVLKKFASSFIYINDSEHWFPTQLMAYLATYKFIPDGDEFLEHNLVTDYDNGLYNFLQYANRSDWVKSQTKVPLACALTPIYMAAQKIYNNIPYSKWNITNNLVPSRLYDAMILRDTKERLVLTVEEALELRTKCLVLAGKPQNPATFNSVYHTQGTVLQPKPALARNMLLQTWCAHPSNRKGYMVLDPWDWDSVPEPLIETDTLLESKPTPATLPWETPEPAKKVRRFGRKVSAS